MSFQELIHIFNFPLQVHIHISYMGDWLSSFVNDKARTVSIRELLNAFRCDYFYDFYLPVFYCYLRKMLIYQVAKLVAVLIQMQNHEVFRRSVCHFSDVLVSRDFNNLAILDLLGLGLQLGQSVGIKLLSKFIIFVEIVFHFLELCLVFICNDVFNFSLFSMFFLHDLLLFVESSFLLKRKVIAVLNLNIEPFSSNFVSH